MFSRDRTPLDDTGGNSANPHKNDTVRHRLPCPGAAERHEPGQWRKRLVEAASEPAEKSREPKQLTVAPHLQARPLGALPPAEVSFVLARTWAGSEPFPEEIGQAGGQFAPGNGVGKVFQPKLVIRFPPLLPQD